VYKPKRTENDVADIAAHVIFWSERLWFEL